MCQGDRHVRDQRCTTRTTTAPPGSFPPHVRRVSGRIREVTIGPLRTSAGLADVHFDGERLRLVVFRGVLDLLDRYRLTVLAAAATTALASWYADPPGRWVALGAAALAAAAAGLAPRRTGTVREWAEPDLRSMDPVHGAVRVHLVLHPTTGDLRLSGWFWRRRQLDHLQRVLGRD